MKIKIFLLIFIYAMLTWSCNTHVVVPSPVPSTSFTSMIAATELPPLKLTPSLTPTPVASITRSLFPTLSSKDREKKLGELLQTNDNCSKPCFWGISPNTSNFDDTVAFLKSLGSKGLEGLKDSTRYYNVVYSYRDDIIIGLAFTESNGCIALPMTLFFPLRSCTLAPWPSMP